MLSRSDFSVTTDISQHLLGECDFNPLEQWFSNFFWYALLQMLKKRVTCHTFYQSAKNPSRILVK